MLQVRFNVGSELNLKIISLVKSHAISLDSKSGSRRRDVRKKRTNKKQRVTHTMYEKGGEGARQVCHRRRHRRGKGKRTKDRRDR